VSTSSELVRAGAVALPRRPHVPGPVEMICTLGPSSLNERAISQLELIGFSTFRVNMSHTEIADLERVIRFIQGCTEVPICIDTEGAQIRTGLMQPGATLAEGTTVHLVSGEVRGDASTLPLTPGYAIEGLHRGTRMSVDFDSALLRIDRGGGDTAEATVLTGGEVGSRKAVTAFPSPKLTPFSEKDLAAIQIARRNHVHMFALSFCDHPRSVLRLREMVGPDATIIAKIESQAGVRNLTGIARHADRLLIDRGDLSREVRIEAIPTLQKSLIRRSNELGVPVYVATNLLESMVTRRGPTRAEVNDVINTLQDGANGLVLAAETAIGKYPIEAARMIATLLREHESSLGGYHLDDLLGDHPLSTRRTAPGAASRLGLRLPGELGAFTRTGPSPAGEPRGSAFLSRQREFHSRRSSEARPRPSA
jgi:pyruvate kinase